MGGRFEPNLVTVQGAVQDVLGEIFNHPIKLIGSGRTDRGTHAKGQIAHFELPNHYTDSQLTSRFNSMLKRDIRIRSVQICSDDFHAQYSAKDKQYSYTICNGFVDDALKNRMFLNTLIQLIMKSLNPRRRYSWVLTTLLIFHIRTPVKIRLGTIHDVLLVISKPYS